ncbi:MAG: ArsC/Spx/MgsR family protein [Candidatus Thiodiazotropha sp.]
MSELVFFEKPGCVGNNRQKAILREYGITFEVRDLLTTQWTANTLRTFFSDTPVSQWFNDSAPRVKSGEIPIDQMDEASALLLMVDDPILIRRPLMACDGLKQSGFVPGPVLDHLGIRLDAEQDLQSCPRVSQPCEEPR